MASRRPSYKVISLFGYLCRHVTALGVETKKESEEDEDRPDHSGAWVGEMAFLDYYWHKEQRKIANIAPKVYVPKNAIYTIFAATDCVVLRWSHEELEELMGTSNDLRSALTRAMTSSLVSKVVNMTVSKSKQMPTWSHWLSDWSHSAGASVNVSSPTALAEVAEKTPIATEPETESKTDENLALEASW
jgi:CRP-like cAMP-binding protein